MRINRSLLSLLPLALFLSCQKGMVGEDGNVTSPSGNPVLMKVLNSSENSDLSSLMIFMEQEPDAQLLEDWAGSGVLHVGKLFTSVPGNEEREARFGLDKWYLVELEERLPLNKAVELIAEVPSVSRIQYNTRLSLGPETKCIRWTPSLHLADADRTPFNDPMMRDQWHYINTGDKSVSPKAVAGGDINVKDAWNLVTGDPELVVAVVDEGVMYTHPDLAANMWINTGEIPDNGKDDDGNGYIDDVHGYNFVTDGAISWQGPKDIGHGTHVAGTVAAVSNNGIGVAGVAGGSGKQDGVKLMSCQIFANDRSTQDALARAYKYAADNGACIIQGSFGAAGGAFHSDNEYAVENGAEIAALEYFRSKSNYPAMTGGLTIFAAGNETHPCSGYPGALRDNISVCALGPDFLPAFYTNYGPGCNISAPGGDQLIGYGSNMDEIARAMVLSTVPAGPNKNEAGYGYMQGTSMACPHVSGVAALGLAYARKLGKHFTAKEMTDMILSSTNDLDSRLNGEKTSLLVSDKMNLADYYKKMGTGSIDTWRLFMQIEGIPTVIVESGKRQGIDLSKFFGTASVNLTFLGVDVDEQTSGSLKFKHEPEIKFGKLFVEPEGIGSGKIRIRAIAGGENLGGGDNIGGMEISQEISLISRSFKSSNGGWL